MNTEKAYKARTLFTAYQIGRKEEGGQLYVAVPRRVSSEHIPVEYKGVRLKTKNRLPVCKRTFRDKFGRGTYDLFYYRWDVPLPESIKPFKEVKKPVKRSEQQEFSFE